MLKILTPFSAKFAETCQQQSFPAEVALGLERQNQMLGTGISLMHCATRKVSAELSSQGIKYHFETCTLRGEGDWDITISGPVTGKGKGNNTVWKASVTFQGWRDEPWGNLEVVREEIPEQDTPIAAPNDAGPDARPNGWPKEPVPVVYPIPQKITLQKLRMTTIVLEGSRGYYGNSDRWIEGGIRREETPCKPAEDDRVGRAP